MCSSLQLCVVSALQLALLAASIGSTAAQDPAPEPIGGSNEEARPQKEPFPIVGIVGITVACMLVLMAAALAIHYLVMRSKGRVRGSFLASLMGQPSVGSDADKDSADRASACAGSAAEAHLAACQKPLGVKPEHTHSYPPSEAGGGGGKSSFHSSHRSSHKRQASTPRQEVSVALDSLTTAPSAMATMSAQLSEAPTPSGALGGPSGFGGPSGVNPWAQGDGAAGTAYGAGLMGFAGAGANPWATGAGAEASTFEGSQAASVVYKLPVPSCHAAAVSNYIAQRDTYEHSSGTRTSSSWATSNSTNTASSSLHARPVVATAKGAAAARKLCRVLDDMHAAGAKLGDRYILESGEDRIVGTQGVVQFASLPRTMARFAIKFFLDKRAFAMEQHIQSLDSLKLAISAPEIILANTGGGICSPDGAYTFPSLTVTEEGEPLEVWLKGSNPAADYITCVQLISQMLTSVQALHWACYAHRNIKPSNILRRLKQHDWILTDFDSAAPLGSKLPPSSHSSRLRYAAPENVADPALATEQQKPVEVTCAGDVWAIGMIAYELLTEERVFAPEATDEEIIGALRKGPLPWERGDKNAEERLRKLRGLRYPVIGCLSRTPEKRGSAGALLSAMDRMLDSTTTRGTFATSQGAPTVGTGSQRGTSGSATGVITMLKQKRAQRMDSMDGVGDSRGGVAGRAVVRSPPMVAAGGVGGGTAATDTAATGAVATETPVSSQSYSSGYRNLPPQTLESFKSCRETLTVTGEGATIDENDMTFVYAQGTTEREEGGEDGGGQRGYVSGSSLVFIPE